MSLWMVRAGKYGERESVALDKNVVIIGWNELPDLSEMIDMSELGELYRETYSTETKKQVENRIGQIWRFIHEINKDDLVALPLKTQSAIAIGEITGNYEYKELSENVKHTRSVRWLKTIPRSAFDQDLLYSLGASMTVCGIKRNNAEDRIKALLDEKTHTEPIEPLLEEGIIDIETYAKDEIAKYIGRKFKGHNLERLVGDILKAQGYTTKVSPPGPDGGVDILASGGSLGFDHPRICVQVKSSSSPANVSVLRDLKGTMRDVNAEQGLLVSWGGFNREIEKLSKNDFFAIRLWDSGDLLDAVFRYYDKFDDELKAELPLKRMWALVLEENNIIGA